MMGPSNEGYNDSFFAAVRQDIFEVVDEILFNSPATINCKDEDGYNIIQLSTMNRAEKVCNLIYHIIEHTKSQREMTDSSLNNLAHMAGRLAPSFVLSRTAGAVLQLQRELLCFELVERLVLPLQLTENNIYKETPLMVFAREHQDLLKEGEIWMKTTAESCSITAALIVTVVFAAAIIVPGGSDEESGILCSEKNSPSLYLLYPMHSCFSRALPHSYCSGQRSSLQVDFGLLMLFLSAIAMMVAFGAILFLVFCDKRPWMLAPICTFALLPISVIVTIKLPLLGNLIQSTFFPMIGNKSYLDSCKVSRKKTIFMM
ncbi:putative PGG domain-containing protein [Helianthus debilis subsp. tardiflorus]